MRERVRQLLSLRTWTLWWSNVESWRFHQGGFKILISRLPTADWRFGYSRHAHTTRNATPFWGLLLFTSTATSIKAGVPPLLRSSHRDIHLRRLTFATHHVRDSFVGAYVAASLSNASMLGHHGGESAAAQSLSDPRDERSACICRSLMSSTDESCPRPFTRKKGRELSLDVSNPRFSIISTGHMAP